MQMTELSLEERRRAWGGGRGEKMEAGRQSTKFANTVNPAACSADQM